MQILKGQIRVKGRKLFKYRKEKKRENTVGILVAY